MTRLPSERSCLALDDQGLLETGRKVMTDEALEIEKAAGRLGPEIAQAARAFIKCKGRIVVSGLGKSGHIGRKIAGTLASLGTPAFFLHSAEASHGDLGMVRREDSALLISQSGRTKEVLCLVPFFKRLGSLVVAITGDMESPLAKEADLVLDSSVEKEADPLNLAPTSSAAVQMAIGDALSGVVTAMRNLKKEDFALFHPGGNLGKKLLLRLSDVMAEGGKLPVVKENASVKEALFEITSKNYGATAVVDEKGLLTGIFTDGDLRRLMEKAGVESLGKILSEVMTKNPHTMKKDRLAAEALKIMESQEISVVIVEEEGRPLGMVHLHELLQAGVS